MGSLLDNLVAAVPLMGRLAGGNVILTDRDGHCLLAVDRQGRQVDDVDEPALELCRRAAEAGDTRGELDAVTGVEHLAVPINGYVLFLSNVSKVARRNDFLNTLKETLPLIARVAGGEAVVFDREGRRIFTADPTSDRAKLGSGTVSEPCREVMLTGRPNIAASRTVAGAMAVRIPINPSFGFGFNNATAVRQKERLLDQVKSSQTGKYSWDDIVGHGARIAEVVQIAKKAAQCQSSVMLVGESGTGKELFAQAIHNASPRSHGPFIALNCSAIPESLVESTLFGYEEGAFTGAQKGGRAGVFEQARGGTLLLDEISEMPLDSQAKLLRVLQEREVCRIGSTKPIPVDVRVICTSNRDLPQYVKAGRFRHDLFYRLNVIDIPLPPLRERREDIGEIAQCILDRLFRQNGRMITAIDAEAMARLRAYDWPGNCRELHNVLERAVNLANGEVLTADHFAGLTAAAADRADPAAPAEAPHFLAGHLAEAEQTLILAALQRHGGRRVDAARELGISTTTLWRRLRKLGKDSRPSA